MVNEARMELNGGMNWRKEGERGSEEKVEVADDYDDDDDEGNNRCSDQKE